MDLEAERRSDVLKMFKGMMISYKLGIILGNNNYCYNRWMVIQEVVSWLKTKEKEVNIASQIILI